VSEHDDEPDFLKSGGPVINADGRVEGNVADRIARIEPEARAEAPLELATREKPPERMIDQLPHDAPLPSRRRGLWLVAIAVLAGAGLFAASLVVPSLQPAPQRPDTVRESSVLDALAGAGLRGTVIVTSEPPGATVRIAGQQVGVTPWAGDNVWHGDAPVELSLPGYKPWKGSIRGGQEAQLNARLTK